MGLNTTLLTDLIEMKRIGALHPGAGVVEIGAQQLSNDFLRATETLSMLADAFGTPRLDFGPADPIPTIVNGVELQSKDAPGSRPFWERIGFSYAAIDLSDERDIIRFDLNRDTVPPDLVGAFDLAVNAGTTEHVANQDNAFRAIHDLVRVDGIMWHNLPCQGMLTHGLINYTPKFFWMLCKENLYEVLRLEVIPYGFLKISNDVIVSNHPWKSGDQRNFDPIPVLDLVAILRKKHNEPFKTPLDLPTY